MKKRIFALIMALCLVFALAACGQADTEESHAPAESEEPAGSETPAGTEEPEESEAPEALSAEVTLEEELSTVEEDGVTYMTAQSVAPNVTIEGADEAAQAIASVLSERLTVPQEDIDEYSAMAREHYDTLDETEREAQEQHAEWKVQYEFRSTSEQVIGALRANSQQWLDDLTDEQVTLVNLYENCTETNYQRMESVMFPGLSNLMLEGDMDMDEVLYRWNCLKRNRKNRYAEAHEEEAEGAEGAEGAEEE